MQEKLAKIKELKMLFVEDEPDLINIISTTLTKLNLNFLTANNGEEALELYKNNLDIDLIITDINMPKMNGLALIENVRDIDASLPVIIMSAHTEQEYIKKAAQLGVTSYLLKPFDFIKFIDLVSKLDIK
jgi:YesN/AraC family two-component response regulator